MADWTSLLPAPAPQTNVGGLLDLANKAYELQAAPYRVQQQQSAASDAARTAGTNTFGAITEMLAPYSTMEKPTDRHAAQAFLSLGNILMPPGSPPNAQSLALLSQLHQEYDALPKGDSAEVYKARRKWFGDVAARYGGSKGNLETVPVYDQRTNSIIQVPRNVAQREIATSGGTTGVGGPPPPSGAPAGAVMPPGSFQSAPGPAQEESGKAYVKARDEATNYPREITPMYEAYRAVQALEATGKNKTFGPGVTERARLQGAIQALSPDLARSLKIDPNSVTAVNEFDKWSANIALNVPGGRQNQDTFAATVAGNPNSHMDNATIKQMLATNIGLTNMWQVAQREAMQKGQANFSDNARQEFDNLDRRAFALNFMTPEVRKRTMDDVRKESPAAQARFARSYKLMQQYETSANLQVRPPRTEAPQ